MSFIDKIKHKTWKEIYKFFIPTQRAFLKLGIIKHEGRQKYHIGWLAGGKTLEDLKEYLHREWGFGNHFVAWVDEGQVLSWRKLDGFKYQYHLRVFKDGEIRGHYEVTPEAHPLDHFLEKGESHRNKEFIEFLGGFVTKEKTNMHLEMDPNAFDPDSEMSIDKVVK